MLSNYQFFFVIFFFGSLKTRYKVDISLTTFRRNFSIFQYRNFFISGIDDNEKICGQKVGWLKAIFLGWEWCDKKRLTFFKLHLEAIFLFVFLFFFYFFFYNRQNFNVWTRKKRSLFDGLGNSFYENLKPESQMHRNRLSVEFFCSLGQAQLWQSRSPIITQQWIIVWVWTRRFKRWITWGLSQVWPRPKVRLFFSFNEWLQNTRYE